MENDFYAQDLRKKISALLLIYCVMTLALRITDYGGIVFFSDALLSRAEANPWKYLYYALPLFMYLYSLSASKPDAHVGMYALVEALNILPRIVLGPAVMIFGAPFHYLLGLWALSGCFLAPVVLLLRNASRLARLKNSPEGEKEEKSDRNEPSTGSFAPVVMALWMVFCYVTPVVNPSLPNLRALWSATRVIVHSLDADIRHMTASPDGKLLALATDKGLHVWDAVLQKQLWSKGSMDVHRVRFSGDGRYLAAAGQEIPGGKSAVTVYEVDGFRLLPEPAWPEGKPFTKPVFHDMAFLPGGDRLFVAWNRDWDLKRISTKELHASGRSPTDDVELFLTDVDIKGGEILSSKKVNDLSHTYEAFPAGSVYLSPSGSYLYYPKWYEPRKVKGGDWSDRKARILNTRTWEEQEILFAEILFGIQKVQELQIGWRGVWRFCPDEKSAWFLGGYASGNLYSLCKLNFETMETDVALESPWMSGYPWLDLALSPGARRAVLPCRGETRGIALLRIVDLETKKTWEIVCKHDRTGIAREYRFPVPLRAVWVSEETIAVTLSGSEGFFFVDVREGE